MRKVNINITKMSSKGQIVIPSEMRKDFNEGEQFIIIKDGKRLILKSVKDLDKNLKEDIIFAKRTEEAWKRYDKGEFIKMDFDEFLKEIKKW
ncbi:MAG TPA: AbrB/MazE/SpoVT family DNA-binding domain-containing protein [Candidatus Nanoarchaeia archaeon]|nr:AbrB/MazE/SpoVT family DNA-binding domain-containing protein [Candidatus Nanoarchaeia archaeon]